MVRASLLACRLYDILAKTHLASYLDGERATRFSHLEAKEWLNILNIEAHSAIGDTLALRGVVLDVGVVGSDNTIAPLR